MQLVGYVYIIGIQDDCITNKTELVLQIAKIFK